MQKDNLTSYAWASLCRVSFTFNNVYNVYNVFASKYGFLVSAVVQLLVFIYSGIQ